MKRGFTLLEVLVAVAILGTTLVALQQVLGASSRGIAAEMRLTRAMLLARTLLSEATLSPPPPGHLEGALDGRGAMGAGLRFSRDVTTGPLPSLRTVDVRVFWNPTAARVCELVEVIRAPAS